jgi:putative DNA primase/helicase
VIDFDEYRKALQPSALKAGKPASWDGIKAKCIAYRNEWLEYCKENSDGKNYPKQLNEYAVAKGINKILYTVTLENGKVAIYDPERGYYQKDYKYAYKIIHVLQPTFNETKARNVLFLLSSMDRKFQYNGIYCDFEPEYRNNRRFILVKNGIYDKEKCELLPFDYKFINFSIYCINSSSVFHINFS